MVIFVEPLTYYEKDEDGNVVTVKHPYSDVWVDKETGMVDVVLNIKKFNKTFKSWGRDGNLIIKEMPE